MGSTVEKIRWKQATRDFDNPMREHEKIAYEVDPHNRLVLKSGRKSSLRKYRLVLDGTFKTDRNNYLVYHLKKPSPVFLGRKVPQNIKLKGSWSLTKAHNLVYTLDKWQGGVYGNRLVLKGGPMDAGGNSLLFILSTKDTKARRTYALGLSGRWSSDRFNRLSFLIKRENGRYARLIFKSKWKVDKNNQIIYEYKKDGKAYRITFKGIWNITEKHKIIYTLDKRTYSGFEFRVGPGIYRKGFGLKYYIGIGVLRRKQPKINAIIILGKWKVSKKSALHFEMRCGEGKIQRITFGISIRSKNKNTVEIELRGKKDCPLGIKFILSKRFLKGRAATYLTFRKDKTKFSVAASAGFLF